MVDAIKWKQFSLAEQMANIGSEVGRAVALKEKEDRANAQKSAEQVLSLINLTIVQNQKNSCLGELLRLKEIFSGYFFGTADFLVSRQDWDDYFLPFAIAARK